MFIIKKKRGGPALKKNFPKLQKKVHYKKPLPGPKKRNQNLRKKRRKKKHKNKKKKKKKKK
ncbi:hypothetical protein, partial [Neokomagataea anthophila]